MAFVLLGCAAPFEIIPSASYLPTAAQVEEDGIRLAIPSDLQAKLNEEVAKWNSVANRQYVAQVPTSPIYEQQQRLTRIVLEWAAEKPPAERLVLQKRPSVFLVKVRETQKDAGEEAPSLIEDPRVQGAAGVVAGAAIGAVPFGPYAADVGIELKVLPQGTYYARVGRVCGELISGTIQIVAGCAGMTGGVAASGSGGGLVVGVPLISASFALVLNGGATLVHAAGEAEALWREGPPPDAPPSAPPEKLLRPKTRPKQPAQAQPTQTQPAQTPPKQATPAVTSTTTRNKSTGVTTKKTGTTTTPKGKPAQSAAEVKPNTTEAQSAADVKPSVKDAPTTVYRSVNKATGKVEYVGITNDLARREVEHMRQRGLPIDEFMVGLSRSDAIAVEQALIEMHGLGKNGGTLLNKINSIAKTNPTYAQQVKRGYDLLESMAKN
jgi:hypothetical protein